MQNQNDNEGKQKIRVCIEQIIGEFSLHLNFHTFPSPTKFVILSWITPCIHLLEFKAPIVAI